MQEILVVVQEILVVVQEVLAVVEALQVKALQVEALRVEALQVEALRVEKNLYMKTKRTIGQSPLLTDCLIRAVSIPPLTPPVSVSAGMAQKVCVPSPAVV